jgi:hypothetical protein
MIPCLQVLSNLLSIVLSSVYSLIYWERRNITTNKESIVAVLLQGKMKEVQKKIPPGLNCVKQCDILVYRKLYWNI